MPCELSVGGLDGTEYNYDYLWVDACKMFEDAVSPFKIDMIINLIISPTTINRETVTIMQINKKA